MTPVIECPDCNCPSIECPPINCPIVECPKCTCPPINCPVVDCPSVECPSVECPSVECPDISCPNIECENTTDLHIQLDHLHNTLAFQKSEMESLQGERISLVHQLEQEKLYSQSLLNQQSVLETQLRQTQHQISITESLEKKLHECRNSFSEQELEVRRLEHSLDVAENELKSQTLLLQQKDEEIVLKQREMEEMMERMKRESESLLMDKDKEINKLQEEILLEKKNRISIEETLHHCEVEGHQKEDTIAHLQDSMLKDRELCAAGTECSLVYSYFRRYLWSENSKFGKEELTTPNEDYLELQQDQRLIRCLMYNGDELSQDTTTNLWNSSLIFYVIVVLCAILIGSSLVHV